MKAIRENNFTLVFAILLILHVLLIGSLRIYPFVDLPFRMAVATILRFYGDSTNSFAEYYSIPSLFQHNIIYVLFCSLPIFPSVEFANKIFYALYAFLLPVSVLLTIRKLGGNVWFSVLSFLLLYNHNIAWGFAEFVISIPAVLLLFDYTLDVLELESGHVPSKLMVALLFCLLFFMHLLALLFALLVFLACCLYRYRSAWKEVLSANVTIIPVLGLLIRWAQINAAHVGSRDLSFLVQYYKNEYLKEGIYSILVRGKILLYSANYALRFWKPKELIPFFFSFVLLALLIGSLAWHRKNFQPREIRKLGYSTVFLFCALTSFTILPSWIRGFTFLYIRYAVLCWLSVILVSAVASPRCLPRVVIFCMCAICILHLMLWSLYFSNFQKEVSSFTEELLPENPRHTLAGLIYDYQFYGLPVYIHFPNYYIVWRQGIATTTLTDYRFWGIPRKHRGESLPVYNEWVGRDNNYDGRYENMDYILVRGELPQAARWYLRSFELVKSQAEWSLYKNKKLK